MCETRSNMEATLMPMHSLQARFAHTAKKGNQKAFAVALNDFYVAELHLRQNHNQGI